MSGFIPTYKIDKVDVGEGVIMHGQMSCANAGFLQRFLADFQKFITGRRNAEARGQTEIKFDSGLTIGGVKLRAEKPKMKAREYSIGIDMKEVSMEDRSALFAMSQDDSKEIHISIVQKPRPSLQILDKTTTVTVSDEPTSDAPADPPAAETTTETRMVDHSTDKLNLPSFQNDTLEERLQAALLKREGAADRWADRINSGLTDRDLRKAIASEWTDADYEAASDACHFAVKGGNDPKFWLAPVRDVRVSITNKPTLQGAKLLAKVREVLGFEESKPTTKGKSKAKK
jgi:hypothetical protein